MSNTAFHKPGPEGKLMKSSASYGFVHAVCSWCCFCLWLLQISCQSAGQIEKTESINGVCLEAPPRPITAEALAPVREINANWVAVVPYAFTRAGDPMVNYDTARQWWGESKAGVVQTINFARQHQLKVMLKPHVWIQGQGWPGDFTLENEAQWQQWEKSYADYLRIITHIADSMQVEMLCIGTEYRKAVVERPQFWRSLIDTIRSHYQGKLTYAANWDNFENVEFWDQLDYIGIDAYFPLSDKRTPRVSKLVAAWEDPLSSIQEVQQAFGKPVLFTEYGYRSADYSSHAHWMYGEEKLVANPEAQKNAYEAVFQVFWDEPWFAGGFLWKWYAEPQKVRRGIETDYTPQSKPAAEVIKRMYGR